MSNDRDSVPLGHVVEIGVDSFGDPFLRVSVETPEGRAMTPDAVDQLGLKLIAAAASARARGSVIRALMLDGRTLQQAVTAVDHLMRS